MTLRSYFRTFEAILFVSSFIEKPSLLRQMQTVAYAVLAVLGVCWTNLDYL